MAPTPHPTLLCCSQPHLPHSPSSSHCSMIGNSSGCSTFPSLCSLCFQVGAASLTAPHPQGQGMSLQSSWPPRPLLHSPSLVKAPAPVDSACAAHSVPLTLCQAFRSSPPLPDHLGCWAPGRPFYCKFLIISGHFITREDNFSRIPILTSLPRTLLYFSYPLRPHHQIA